MHVTFSNRLELLFDTLIPHIYEHRPFPFAKILIVVPSLGMKNWIMQRAASNHQIAYGFEVVLLNDAIRRLTHPNGKTPNHVELAMRIEEELKHLEEHPFHNIKMNKRAEIALELAEIFLNYGEYAKKGWEQSASHWQANLWKKIFTSAWIPYSQYLENFNPSLPINVHLFGFSYLSEIKQNFFERLNQKIPVYFWILSPSRMLWTDHKSKKEQVFIVSQLEKRGIQFSQIEELQEYLEESHPLIGNNGRLGRKWRERMDDSCSSDIYSVIDHPAFEKFMLDGVKTYSSPLTLLEAIQADLTLLTSQESLTFNDRSIEVHAAVSPLREVEVLYETLLRASLEEEILPGEMLVMAPSFEKYLPFIKMIFGKEGSFLPYEIVEYPETSSPFFELIAFAESRWELEKLFQLIQSLKCPLKREDLEIVKKLFIKEGVHWGINLSHRENHCQKPLIDKSLRGTWEGGFEALIDHLIHANLNNTHAEALNQFIDFFKQFYSDLHPIMEANERSIEEWKKISFHLIQTYLHEEEELNRLLRKMSSEGTFSAKSFFTYLQKLHASRMPTMGVRNLQAVRFCPLLPMRAIPAGVIALLGMNNETFPRIERKSPLFLIETSYIPTPTDYDRYLFLESILSARKKWILSFVETEKDSSSCLVQEFLHYVKKFSSCSVLYQHPDLPCDVRYFLEGSPINSLSSFHYRSALAARNRQTPPSFEIRPPLPIHHLNLEVLPRHLTLHQLKNLFYHPIRYFLNHSHGIYLQKEVFSHPDMEEFSEERLWDSEWLKWALQYPIEQVVELAETQGKLPMEPFKAASKERLKKNLITWKEVLLERNIPLDSIFELEFSYDCKKLEQINPTLWKAPAIEIDYHGKSISITGVLPYMSQKGYLSLRDWKKETLVTMIPEMFFLQEIPNQKILFIKKNKEFTPKKFCWNHLLDHYVRALHQPSPLHPTWIPSFLSKEPASPPMPECPYLKWVFPKGEIDLTLLSDWKRELDPLFSSLFEEEHEDI